MPTTVISVENVSKLYRLVTISSGMLSHDLNRAWARLRGSPTRSPRSASQVA